jgi:hypothetical protein
MNPESFNSEEQNALRECVASLRALACYESADFEAIAGFTKDEAEAVYASFPNWDLYDEAADGYDASGLVIHNAFNWLMNGTEEEKRAMRSRLSFDEKLLALLYEKVRKL